MKYYAIIILLIAQSLFSCNGSQNVEEKQTDNLSQDSATKKLVDSLILEAVNIDSGKQDLAIQYLNRAISLDPNNEAAFHYRGLVFEQLNKYDSALADYDRAIEIDSIYETAYKERGFLLLKMNRKKEACDDLYKCYKIGMRGIQDDICKECPNLCDSLK